MRKNFPGWRRTAASFSLAAALGCCFRFPIGGAEIIHLTSGFDLNAKSHTLSEAVYTLQTDTGTIEVPASEVAGIDAVPGLSRVPTATPTDRAKVTGLVSMIREAAASQAVNPEFLRFVQCVAQVESRLRQSARSSKGANGIMQLMPATAKELGVVTEDAPENVKGGAKYLRQLLVRYHNDSALALAAYNAGPGAVKKYGGVPPYVETRRYIQKVLQAYAILQVAR